MRIEACADQPCPPLGGHRGRLESVNQAAGAGVTVGEVDQLVLGGGIANTFLAASGSPVGKSLCEHELIPTAQALMQKTNIPLPVDVVTGKAFSEDAVACLKPADEVAEDDMIFDIGPESAQADSAHS